jgi:hypothetical protein
MLFSGKDTALGFEHGACEQCDLAEENSATSIEPRDDLRPHFSLRLAPDQDSEMLQRDPNFSRIFDDTHILREHRVGKRLDRGSGFIAKIAFVGAP